MRRRIFIPLMVVHALSGCGSCHAPPPAAVDAGPPGPRKLTEVEPNDDADHAQLLDGEVIVEAQISPRPGHKADEDWYRIQTPGNATIVAEPAPGLDLILEITDADHIKRLSQDAQGPGKAEAIHDLAGGKSWWLRVAARRVEQTGTYTLRVSLPPAGSLTELEPNNRSADATPLPLDQPLQGQLTDPADEDWYRIDLTPDAGPDAGPQRDDGGPPIAGTPPPVPALPSDGGSPLLDAGQDAGLDAGPDAGAADAGPDAGPPPIPPTLVHLTVTGIPEVRLEVSVLNLAEAPLFSVRGKGPGDGIEVRNLAIREPGAAFFVVIKSAWMGERKEAHRGFSLDGAYALTVSRENAHGAVELEPNDDPAHATPVDPSGLMDGFISSKGDVDWYLLHSDQPRIARAEVSGVEHLDLELSAIRLGPDGKEVASITANDGEVKEPEVLTNLSYGPGQDLYLKVEGALRKTPQGKWVRDYANPHDPYHLTVSSGPDDGSLEREPNNTPQTATPIALGQTIKGTIHPKKDVDFYKLDLSDQQVKTQLRATCSGILKVDIALYLLRLDPDGSTTLVQTSDTGKAEASESISYAAEPGVYLFKVQDTRNRESNFLDYYQLRLEQP